MKGNGAMCRSLVKDRLVQIDSNFYKLVKSYFLALLLAYMKGNGAMCRSLVKAGAMLGTLNNNGVSIFNSEVATKQVILH